MTSQSPRTGRSSAWSGAYQQALGGLPPVWWIIYTALAAHERRCRPCDRCDDAAGHIAFLGPPQMVQEDGELPRDGDDRAFLRGFAAARGEPEAPAAQISVGAEGAEDVLGTADQEASQQEITRFRDMTFRIARARRAPPRTQTEIAADGATGGEAGGIFQREDEAERRQRGDAGDLREGLRFLICCRDQLLHRAIGLANLAGQRGDLLEHRRELRSERDGQRRGRLTREALRRTARQAAADGFGAPPHMIHEQRAGADQRVARAHLAQRDLRVGAPMVDGPEELWIDAAQAREQLGVDAIGFGIVLRDELHAPRVGDNRLVAGGLEDATEPGRMGATLDHDARQRHHATPPRDCLRRRCDSAIFNASALGVDGIEVRVPVANVETDGEPLGAAPCTTRWRHWGNAPILVHKPPPWLDLESVFFLGTMRKQSYPVSRRWLSHPNLSEPAREYGRRGTYAAKTCGWIGHGRVRRDNTNGQRNNVCVAGFGRDARTTRFLVGMFPRSDQPRSARPKSTEHLSTMPTAFLNDITITYDDLGESPHTVLLVHGHPFDRSMWRPQLSAVRDAGWRVIVPDLRGYGESSVVPGKTTLDVFAADLAALLDHLGIDDVVIGGLSMGGQIVMEFARRYPQRVRGLLLAATFPQSETDEGKRNRNAMADRLLREGMRAYADEVLPKMLAPRSIETLPRVADHVTAMMRATNPEGAAAAVRGRAERPSYESTLADVTAPALVVVGSDDAFTTRQDAERMRDLLVASELVWLEGVGHMPNLERTTMFNAALVRFLKRLELRDVAV
jgi:pimeloyl-ACP methyl ester carboxylesterase